MNTIQEVQAYLKSALARMHTPQAPEQRMAVVLEELASKCQSVEEFVEKAQQIPVTGAGIEQVAIANEYREIVLNEVDND